jgi:hypothetical protein
LALKFDSGTAFAKVDDIGQQRAIREQQSRTNINPPFAMFTPLMKG